MEANPTQLESDICTLPLFPLEFRDQKEAKKFKHDWETNGHDWETNPNFFNEQNERFALCNPLFLPSAFLDEIKEKLEKKQLGQKDALWAIFAMCGGWSMVTNQINETAHYDYQALADRIGMARSSMRRWFNWGRGEDQRLWRLVPGGGVEFLEEFLRYSDIPKAAREIMRERGRQYPQTLKAQAQKNMELFADNAEGNLSDPSMPKVALRDQLTKLNSVVATELVLESNELPSKFVEKVSTTIEDESKAHGFDGRINPKLLIRAAEALWREGCRQAAQAKRYIKILVGSLALRGDTSRYRAHTIAGIVRDDADNWRLLLKQTPESRSQDYIEHSTTTRLKPQNESEFGYPKFNPTPESENDAPSVNQNKETYESLVQRHESPHREAPKTRIPTRNKAKQDVFTTRDLMQRAREAEAHQERDKPKSLTPPQILKTDPVKTPSGISQANEIVFDDPDAQRILEMIRSRRVRFPCLDES